MALPVSHLLGPSNSEKAFIVTVLVGSLGAFQNLLVTGRIQTQNMGMLGMQILWSLVYLVVLAMFARSCTNPFARLCSLSPIIAVVLLAFISALWSQDPQLTMRRSIALMLTLVLGTYLYSRFTEQEYFRLLAWTFGICIVFSFFFEWTGANPSQGGGAGWYGVFYLKTQLGANMTLSTLVFLFWRKVEPQRKHLASTGLLASLALVFLSRDVTSILAAASLLCLTPCLPWIFRKNIGWAMLALGIFLCFGTALSYYAASNLQRITGLMGKDPMLTGRVPLWILATAMALQKPWFGYGFEAFWLPRTMYVRRIWQILAWMPPHAHNGALELWLELGLVGVGLFFLGFGYYLLRSIKFIRLHSGPAAAWPLVFLLLLFITNLTETHFLVPNNLFFILYVGIAASLVQHSRTRPATSHA
jgi:exopolysaccharide production protein ExoQ